MLMLEQKVTEYLVGRFGEVVRDDVELFFSKDEIKLREVFNFRTLLSSHSELKSIKNNSEHTSEERPFYSQENIAGPLYDGKKRSRVVFVNGIMTPYELAIDQRDYLANMTGQSVGLMYNPMTDWFNDLLRCHQDRRGKPTETVYALADQLESMLASPYPITVVGYSQGAIVASRALKILSSRLPAISLRRLRYVTFGAGFKDSDLPPSILQEHFANLRDPIPHLGLFHPDFVCTGDIYTRDAHGHMLIADYLAPDALSGFEVDKTSSHFLRLINA